MPNFRPDELAQWLSTEWRNRMPGVQVTGISNDTRTLRPGDLYVAIRGDNFDGHNFVHQAFELGAAGALVQEGFDGPAKPLLYAPEPIEGLQALAAGYRNAWSGRVIGITGSVGKTTVKEMCADVLSMQGETHRTAGNYNNHIGLPLSMLAMPRQAAFGVFEIGMNHPGEIGHLAGLLRPDVGIITDIANAHREAFGSLEEIAYEKAQLAAAVPVSGMVILDRDSEWFDLICRHTCAGVRTISLGGGADYVGRQFGPMSLVVTPQTTNHKPQTSSPEPQTYPMPLPGEHMMRNALRAIALGLEAGLSPADVSDGLCKFKAAPMRWEKSNIKGITFINDAYNANPLSMRANLRTFAALPAEGRKWAVVGGMRELGDIADAEHAALGRFIDGLDFDGVILAGELGQAIVCAEGEQIFHASENAVAAQILKENLQPGDRVLLKASRGERLEQVMDIFKEI